MQIHALSTETVRVKHAFLYAIHMWLIEHEGRRILVDTDETAAAHDMPFAGFDVEPAQELPAALARVGLEPGDIDQVLLLFAGDATDTLEQLHARRPDAVAPKPAVHVHDPGSMERLESGATL